MLLWFGINIIQLIHYKAACNYLNIHSKVLMNLIKVLKNLINFILHKISVFWIFVVVFNDCIFWFSFIERIRFYPYKSRRIINKFSSISYNIIWIKKKKVNIKLTCNFLTHLDIKRNELQTKKNILKHRFHRHLLIKNSWSL
jgi:hypothetical protein